VRANHTDSQGSQNYTRLHRGENEPEEDVERIVAKDRFFAALYKPPCRFPGSEARLIRKFQIRRSGLKGAGKASESR
jgi:hypothetical protein